MIFDILTRFRPQIEAALQYGGGTHTFDDVALCALTGRYHLWPQERSIVVTEILEFPRLRALNLFLIGGELDEVLTLQPKLEQFAREKGCTEMRGSGRKGWLRALPGDWKPGGYTMIRSL